MNPEQRLRAVESVCVELLTEGLQISFDEVAARTGLGRATLYRNPELRATVEEHRARSREPHTLTGLAAGISHLRTALDAVAAKVRSHEEELQTPPSRTTSLTCRATSKRQPARISRITRMQRLRRTLDQDVEGAMPVGAHLPQRRRSA